LCSIRAYGHVSPSSRLTRTVISSRRVPAGFAGAAQDADLVDRLDQLPVLDGSGEGLARVLADGPGGLCSVAVP